MLLAGASTPSQASTPAPASPAVKADDSQKLPPDSAPLSEHALPHAHDTASQMLQNDEFWADLKDFLVQRLRDEDQGERLVGLFRKAAT
jgi:hypothetical protein